MSVRVVIVDYDPAWPQMYEEEKALILGAMGERLLAIEHVGSTSVPGLAAKPIIDIIAGVRRLDDAWRASSRWPPWATSTSRPMI